MKIIKIEFNKKNSILTVWTDAVEDTGFGFKIDDVIDKDDLKNKIKAKVQNHLDEETIKSVQDTKHKLFKSLENTEI